MINSPEMVAAVDGRRARPERDEGVNVCLVV